MGKQDCKQTVSDDEDLPDFPMWLSLNGWFLDLEYGDWLNMNEGTFADSLSLYGVYFTWLTEQKQ